MEPVEPSQESTLPPPTEASPPSPVPSTARVYGNLLFYRLPPIADRAFLETVLRTKNIGRSLFFGTGPNRTALVELTDKEEAIAIYDVLRFTSPPLESDPTIPSSMPSSSSALSDGRWIPVSGLHKPTRRLPLRVERDTPLPDSVPLAECYLHSPPAVPPSAYAYLQFLRYREHRILLAWSPLAVDAFFQSGGVVPTKHIAAGGGEVSSKPAKNRPAPASDGGKKRPREASTSQVGTGHTMAVDGVVPPVAASTASSLAAAVAGAPSPPTVVFPKGCCQKCGSSSHFTRHCTGAVALPTESTASTTNAAATTFSPVELHPTLPSMAQEEETTESSGRKKRDAPDTKTVMNAVVAPPLPSASSSSSWKDHPRHGEKIPTVSAAASSMATHHTGVPPHSSSSSSFATPVKESKDQCKHCGSTEHFSRHCPSKK